MADSHFSDFRNRSSNRDRSSSHFRSKSSIRKSTSQFERSSIQFHSKSSNQFQFDRSSSQFHSRFPNSQFQRQQFEFNNKFFKFFQGVQNKFFIIDENFEYINDCLKQYTEKRIEDQIL